MELMLEYQNKQKDLLGQVNAKTLKLDQLPVLQELNYRLCVLETLKAFCKTAPITLEEKALGYHFQLVSAYIRFLPLERKFGMAPNEQEKAERETSLQTLERVIADVHRQFPKPMKPEQYKKNVGEMINAILCVWIPFRNTYIKI